MLKNKNLWLKIAVVLALSVSSLSVFAGIPEVKDAVNSSALGELLDGTVFNDFIKQPEPEAVTVPAAAPVKAAEETRAAAPAPGRDFAPKIEDAARVKYIMKLITDIYNGANLPYSQDGTTFTNREGRLPAQPLGFYKEYTLITGNAPHTVIIGGTTFQVSPDLGKRGSERIIIGGGEKIYYTPDHYANFIQLKVVN